MCWCGRGGGVGMGHDLAGSVFIDHNCPEICHSCLHGNDHSGPNASLATLRSEICSILASGCKSLTTSCPGRDSDLTKDGTHRLNELEGANYNMYQIEADLPYFFCPHVVTN